MSAAGKQVALWYLRYRQASYALWDDEEEAAGVGAAMEADGGAVVTGVQFADGRAVPRNNWTAFAAARQRLLEVEEAPLPPRAVRRRLDPFSGDMVEVDACDPEWLGREPPSAGDVDASGLRVCCGTRPGTGHRGICDHSMMRGGLVVDE